MDPLTTDRAALVWTTPPTTDVRPSAPPAVPASAVTLVLTAGALAAFAANTLLARVAMADGHIDAAAYTSVRLLSTVVALAAAGLIMPARDTAASHHRGTRGSWLSAALVLGSTLASTAGLALVSASTGALIFFVTAQATMFAAGLATGERSSRLQWSGVAVAIGGLVLMLAPGALAPSPTGAALLVTAGTCWGFYSLRGRASRDPFATTRGNFLRCLPVAVPAALVLLPGTELTAASLIPPVLSGAVASSLGGVLWYAAAARLDATRAATAQLTVPVLGAIGGVLLLGETPTTRLLVAGILVLAGSAAATAKGSRRRRRPDTRPCSRIVHSGRDRVADASRSGQVRIR